MVTFVGTQTDFGSALNDLIELEYDVIEAYEAAINRLDSEEYKGQLELFKQDHTHHIAQRSALLEKHNLEASTGPSAGKQWITKGKVLLANLVGDSTILLAIRSNAIDTNTAYERVLTHDHIWDDAQILLKACLKDELRHKKWLELVLYDQ